MKYYYIFLLICMSACRQKINNKTPTDKTISADTIPELRNVVSKNPVASYEIPMGDRRLDRKFGVEIYETAYTFKYLLIMQYDGMVQSDTLKLPNFGTRPVVEVKPGKENLSCIIGFLDEKNNFREYKMLSAENDELKLTVLKSYGISAY